MYRKSDYTRDPRGSGPFHLLCAALILFGALSCARAAEVPPAVTVNPDGTLRYRADARGNRIPDFSFAGYRGGGVAIPDAPPVIGLDPGDGDDGARIQRALDHVARLAPGPDGLRGAVVLGAGRFDIAGALRIAASGVVLRGAGSGPDGTILVATGTGRRTLVEIAGTRDRVTGAEQPILDDHAPVGTMRLRVAGASGFKPGDQVVVTRPSPRSWIDAVGMGDAPSRPPLVWVDGTVNIEWDRVVTAVEDDGIVLDAPLTTALEARFGGGTVAAYTWPGRVERVGIEHLRCESAFDPGDPEDEEHAWMAIGIDAARDAWVRDIVAARFVSSAVDVRGGASRVTVQDCRSIEPVSELAGYRRHAFHNDGQQVLFLRCESEDGLRDFTVGYLAAGPNVFAYCQAWRTHGFSGSVGSWASGVLFDNVRIHGGELALDNLEDWNQDVGWAAANSVLWQSVASRMTNRRPPGANNWAIGVWSQFRGDGEWSALNAFVEPQSLYQGQLAARLGQSAIAALTPANDITKAAAGKAQRLDDRPRKPDASAKAAEDRAMILAAGWITSRDGLLTGSQLETPTWRGHLSRARANVRGPALTRFVPGRIGPGWTDDLDQLARDMVAGGIVAARHHWGLWYDRRRDDHQMIQRIDGDVWPPFFEQPWARTGPGRTWNGLRRYDLTRFNPWYFGRLRTFADLARAHGRVLIDEMYFQHNILEAGAHWADFPWRPANCVQDTGFPEPPQYAGEKRVFMADLFYDVTHPVRRDLHRAYIRQCLDNLAGQPNVIHAVGNEYTGPLEFAQFWLDVAAGWSAETGKKPLLAISATKDVQDAILADPARGPLISVIDLQYWWWTDDALYAPKGGESLSPRQHERLWKGGRPTANSLAEMAGEYRQRFPGKAVISPLEEADGWAFVAAGGSLPKLPAGADPGLLAALPRMKPLPRSTDAPRDQWTLSDPGREYFIYSGSGGRIALESVDLKGTYTIHAVDLESGHTRETDTRAITHGLILGAADGPAAFWLVRVPNSPSK